MYYETIMQRYGVDENGKDKKFTEKYLVEALSIAEAVTRFETEISVLYPDHETKSVKRTAYTEVLTDDNADARYFHTTYNTVTIDEVTGKEKKCSVAVLIQANDFDDAKAKYEEMIKGYVVDVELVKLTETKIIEFFSAKSFAVSK